MGNLFFKLYPVVASPELDLATVFHMMAEQALVRHVAYWWWLLRWAWTWGAGLSKYIGDAGEGTPQEDICTHTQCESVYVSPIRIIFLVSSAFIKAFGIPK